MMRVLKVLAYLVAAFFALAFGFGHGNQQARVRAEALCAAIPVGMPAAEARQVLAQAGADRLIDTREGVLAVFIGAFQYNRYNCEVVMTERVTATRLSRID
jgi:hypothetical protein